jgi:tricarballylate dehydrogenase
VTGGVKVTKNAQVVASDRKPMPGLYACAEMVGGLFRYDYPHGTGLMPVRGVRPHRGRSAVLS